MDWHSDQMNANGLLRDHQSLTQQNPQTTTCIVPVFNPLASGSKRLRQTRNAVHRNLTTELWRRRSCAIAPHRHTICVRPTFTFADIYAYATGVFSSRKIAKKLHEDVAFRVLGAANRPNARFCGSPVTGSRLESKGGGYRSRPSSEADQYLADVGHALRRLMGRHHLVQTETEAREHLVLELARLKGFGDVAVSYTHLT